MIVKKIRVATIEDAKKLSEAAQKCKYDIDLIQGRYLIDAKSILGIFSLDLSKILDLKIHTLTATECVEFLCEIEDMIIE